MIIKDLKPFLITSLVAHGIVGAAFFSNILEEKTAEKNVVEITYISRPAGESPKALLQPALPAKKWPRNKVGPKKINEIKTSRSVQVAAPLNINSTVAPEASYFLTDPQRGKSYLSYFSHVKEKVSEVVKRQYRRRGSFEGVVALLFVLNKEGGLEGVSVIGDQTTAADVARVFAVQCLENAAPFGAFPKELDSQKISFSITIIFNDRD